MFLGSIALHKTLPCLAEPGKIIVVGRPSSSLAHVLLYLAALPTVIAFNPSTGALTIRRRPGLIALDSGQVGITQVADVEEGMRLLEALTEAINATWEHRLELVPATTGRRAPRPLDLWELFPRTNCRQCGEATCMAFAFGLIQGARSLNACAPLLNDPESGEPLSALSGMLLATVFRVR